MVRSVAMDRYKTPNRLLIFFSIHEIKTFYIRRYLCAKVSHGFLKVEKDKKFFNARYRYDRIIICYSAFSITLFKVHVVSTPSFLRLLLNRWCFKSGRFFSIQCCLSWVLLCPANVVQNNFLSKISHFVWSTPTPFN